MTDFTASDFIPLDPVTFNPYYEQNVPHAVVILNGTSYVPISYQLTLNVHGAIDDATVMLPLSSNPDFTAALAQSDPDSSGGALPVVPIFVEIWAGFRDTPAPTTDLSGLVQRFYGILDTYHMDQDADEVTFTARSLASPFVDQKLTSVVMNQTSVEFVKAMARAIGLQTNIALAPGVVPITVQESLGRSTSGLSSNQNYNAAIHDKHPWDLMLQMALFDDVDIWVSGNTLNYIAPSMVKRTTVNLVYGGDGKSPGLLRPVGIHNTQLSRNIRVEVRSYSTSNTTSTIYRVDSAEGGVIVSTLSVNIRKRQDSSLNSMQSFFLSFVTGKETPVSSGDSGEQSGAIMAGGDSGKILYKKTVHNLMPARCRQLALSLWRQHTMHEFSLSFELPVTKARLVDFSMTSILHVSGLAYDSFNSHNASDMYYPRQINESFDSLSGWKWSVHAVNAILPPGAPSPDIA